MTERDIEEEVWRRANELHAKRIISRSADEVLDAWQRGKRTAAVVAGYSSFDHCFKFALADAQDTWEREYDPLHVHLKDKVEGIARGKYGDFGLVLRKSFVWMVDRHAASSEDRRELASLTLPLPRMPVARKINYRSDTEEVARFIQACLEGVGRPVHARLIVEELEIRLGHRCRR